MMKKLLVFLLATLLLLTLVSCSKQTEDQTNADLTVEVNTDYYSAGGDYDDKYTYEFVDGKTVRITGFVASAVPHAITVPASIEERTVAEIGENAFYSKTNITAVTLPAGVGVIGDSAFSGCSELKSVTFGSPVSKVGEAAFANCIKLEEIVFPEVAEGATFGLATKAFYNCKSLKRVTLPQALVEIPTQCFMQCERLTAVNANKALTKIGESAFAGCAQLVDITLPETAITLGAYAFSDCARLDPPTWYKDAKVGENAFYGCKSTYIDYVVENEEYTDTYTYERIDENTVCLLGFSSSLATPHAIVIPAEMDGMTVAEIGEKAFYYVGNIAEVTIPESVKKIGSLAFAGCGALAGVTVSDGVEAIGASAFRYCDMLTAVELSKSVTTIGNHAFAECGALRTVANTNGVKEIGNSAFAFCHSLLSFTFGAGLEKIGEEAFLDCVRLVEIRDLSSLALEAGSTAHGEAAAHALLILTDAEAGSALVASEDGFVFLKTDAGYVLVAYFGEEVDLILPESFEGELYDIGAYAFYGKETLKSVTIPEIETSVGAGAFAACRALSSVTLPTTLVAIDATAFAGCDALEDAVIPMIAAVAMPRASVKTVVLLCGTEIPENAFANCVALFRVTLPEEVRTIGAGAFENCAALCEIDLPERAIAVGDRAFAGCASLLPPAWADADTVGEDAFLGCMTEEEETPEAEDAE